MEPAEPQFALFRKTLLGWRRENAREYPWRRQRWPYAVAVAEIMLRRTRADQVAPVYERFIAVFPTLAAAAAADPQVIREHLRPLGLAWRAETMVAFLREAITRFGDSLPTEPSLLRELPGVGDYVSGAVACFAADQPVPLIDTNIVRVLGRVFGIDTRGEARRRRNMRDLAAEALDRAHAADYHYALLDFAARVCVVTRPRCEACPFSADGLCEYYLRSVEPPGHQPLVDRGDE